MKSSRALPGPVGILLLTAGIFGLDAAMPPGVAVWALYVVPVRLAHRVLSPRRALTVALTATALVAAGSFTTPSGPAAPFATLNRGLGAGLIWFAAVPIRPGRVAEVGRQAGEPGYDEKLGRLSRFYAALGPMNQVIARAAARDELFEKVCRVLVERAGFDMAWVGWHDPATQRIAPVAVWGDAHGSLGRVRVYGDDRPEGRGPTGQAFRTGRPYVCNGMHDDPITLPWRAELSRHGFNAAAAFPIRSEGAVRGTLTVYSADPQLFGDNEVAFLNEAAGDLSFALDKFAVQEAHATAERNLLGEKEFTDTMLESMPGVVYFYDAAGRFLRWNQNFETVSGYTGEEIGRMHPLDFFAGDDRRRVELAIGGVFARGEGEIEAGFVAKGGTTTPYYFTGRRVEYHGRPCLVGVGIDISARRRAEDRLAESERQYRELVENANSIILRCDAGGRVTFLNEFGQRFFGYTAAEIVGRHVTETILPAAESGGRDLRRLAEEVCAAPEAFVQIVNENVRRTGERVWVSWTNRVVHDAAGRVVEVLSVGTDITERKRAEEALREAELRFHTLFEQTPVGVLVVDPATAAVVECNDQAARQLGYTPRELCRLRVPDVEAAMSAEEVRERIDRLAPDARTEFETRHRTKTGEVRDVLVRVQLVQLFGRPVVHCVCLDVTDRKQGEKRLQESEARYRTLFEHAPDGIVLSDPRGYYLDGNASVCRMLGYAREEFVGLHAADVVAPADLADVGPALGAINRRAGLHREWRFRRKDGSEFPADAIAARMPDGNILGMIRDVSDRKEAEAEREKRYQAEAADRVKSAFLATMSHELRTPLNSIIGFTGILLQGLAGPLNLEQRKQLEMVRTSARHLLALVNDVLDISKIEAGQLEIARERFDPGRAVVKVVALVAPLAEKKGLRLTARLADDLREMVGDERRFEQVLLNLLGNAVKFTDRGEVGLAVDVGPGPGGPAVRLRVSDTGTGIRPADMADLFRPFRQIDSGLARTHDGTGLGLAICRRLTELMGGTIRAESTWGVGSTFSVTLPLGDPAPCGE